MHPYRTNWGADALSEYKMGVKETAGLPFRVEHISSAKETPWQPSSTYNLV